MSDSCRLQIRIRGAVQGVGFRPFVYKLAHSLSLGGQIHNDNRGVLLEVEGPSEVVADFVERLQSELPPRSTIHEIEKEELPVTGDRAFSIVASDSAGPTSAVVLPDLATCGDCLLEVFDSSDRRFGYAFTNCTNCGPRFSIIESLPYDRPGTTMRGFEMCPRCADEYRDPLNRRFHAQPNACPDCGPSLTLVDLAGAVVARGGKALSAAAYCLKNGKILAVKGLGGFHLMVEASNDEAISRLRDRKHRPHKPLALMVADLAMARRICHVSKLDANLLRSPEAPIVLLLRKQHHLETANVVAPGTRELGVMLPSTPMHHLLMAAVGQPLVATSGNRSDEPICTDNDEALVRLGGIAEGFLVHDRPIARHVDDSVVRRIRGAPSFLRRARGYAPYPILLRTEVPTLLATGAHLKCTLALSVENRVFVSQHIGDMETPQARAAFEQVAIDLVELYQADVQAIVHDLHPDYATTQWATQAAAVGASDSVARRSTDTASTHTSFAGLPTIAVQHHHAHLAACLAEHQLEDQETLGITWDGTGYGSDGTIWGGEFLLGTAAEYRRLAHLRGFRLPGGEAAIHEPRRSALSLLLEAGLDPRLLSFRRLWSDTELRLLESLLRSGFNAPLTTSAGRLFDGVACLIGLRPAVSFEGQAAFELEQIVDSSERGSYPMELDERGDGPWIVDWTPMIQALVRDSLRGTAAGIMATRFHHALADASVEVAKRSGVTRVALTGGCFQNRYLTESTARRLELEGFEVLLHRHIPANDGGISLGQIAVAAARMKLESQEDQRRS